MYRRMLWVHCLHALSMYLDVWCLCTCVCVHSGHEGCVHSGHEGCVHSGHEGVCTVVMRVCAQWL